jgi:phosphate:Na+ symporter
LRYRNLILLAVIGILSWGFWHSDDFMQLTAGVALFMFGMLALEQGFQAFTGGVLETVLGLATKTRLRSLGFGLSTTALMQSSSLVSLITISFLSAGLIGLAEGIGIIFGSNIGTTTGAWLMASYGVKIDLASYAMPLAVFGILLIYQKDKVLKGGGHVLLGIAFLFIGIQFIKVGFEALGHGLDLERFALEGLAGVLVFTGIGLLLTVIMQSSHAVLMLTIAALASGQVTYHNALALAIGTNIGTTVTAVLGALGSNAAGKRLAGAHMVFNLTTGLMAIVFIAPLAAFVDWTADWLGIAQDDYTLKLATFHTAFNVLGVGLMLPFIDRLVVFLERRLPETVEIDGVEQPLFLTDAVIAYPDAALVALTRETQHLALNALQILAQALGLQGADIASDEPMRQLVRRSRRVMAVRVKELYRTRIKAIYSAILAFSSKAQPRMAPDQSQQTRELVLASRSMVEAIKDLRLMRKNMARYLVSDNEHMRAVYDLIRLHLGEFIRAVARLREADDPEVVRAELQRLRDAAARDDVVANGTLDKLIRDGLITPDMASSAMNDAVVSDSIHKNLIQAAETLYMAVHGPGGIESIELEDGNGPSDERRRELAELVARSRQAIDERIRGYDERR